MYANSGSFNKAVEDFESALKLNSSHANARKYLGETLVALGRSHEEENHLEDARKAYQDCLNVIPNHEEAYKSLEMLRQRSYGKQIVEPAELELPRKNKKCTTFHSTFFHLKVKIEKKINFFVNEFFIALNINAMKPILSETLMNRNESHKDKKKKDKNKKRRRKRGSSSSSSSSSGSSSDSSSSESSSSGSSSSGWFSYCFVGRKFYFY